jgi:outer membrane protein OmpA-like peptidoglycan-associated protein
MGIAARYRRVRAPVLLIGLPLVACATSGPSPAASTPPRGAADHPATGKTAGTGAAVPGGQSAIANKIYFENARAEITRASYPVLDAIAALVRREPDKFPQLALEGHAAANERTPMRLSLERASAVRLALIDRGVDGGRLFARASGATVPACAHDREVCWERERRVEFAVLHPTPPAPAEPAPIDLPPAPPADAADDDAVVADAPSAGLTQKPPSSRPADSGLLDRVMFARGSAVLAPAALPALDLLAGFLKANPSGLEIEGHAGEGERRPEELARARALAVRAYLVACGVSGDALVVRSRGAAQPACTNRSSACRAENRAVELRFSDPSPSSGVQ